MHKHRNNSTGIKQKEKSVEDMFCFYAFFFPPPSMTLPNRSGANIPPPLSVSSFYDSVVSDLESALYAYMNDSLDILSLRKLSQREESFASPHNTTTITELKREIGEMMHEIYIDLDKIEKRSNVLKSTSNNTKRDIERDGDNRDNRNRDNRDNRDNSVEIDEDDVFRRGLVLGRNKLAGEGAENSQWYLGPYPRAPQE